MWVLLGSSFTSVLNLMATQYLIEPLGYAAIFYLGAILEAVVLVIMYFYKEELDVEHLRKCNAIKEVRETITK
jgi:Na+/melibiose symporter-like transporter